MMVRRRFNCYSTVREAMLQETAGFLRWALDNPEEVPRIPRVRVDSGIRFSERFKVACWSSVLYKLEHIAYRSEA